MTITSEPNAQTPTNPIALLNREVNRCTRCGLAKTRTRAVPGEGDWNAEIMFVGEGPGFNEDKQGRPFVGRGGQLLDSLIQSIGIERKKVYITNVVKCRPPGNRDPMPDEILACSSYLRRQIEAVNPRVIVTLGRFSLLTFFPDTTISKAHGVMREKDGRFIFPLYHPAAALRQERYKEALLDDLQTLSQWLDKDRAPPVELDQPYLDGDRTESDEEENKQLALF